MGRGDDRGRDGVVRGTFDPSLPHHHPPDLVDLIESDLGAADDGGSVRGWHAFPGKGDEMQEIGQPGQMILEIEAADRLGGGGTVRAGGGRRHGSAGSGRSRAEDAGGRMDPRRRD